jgi:hypothetical protein
MLVFVIENKASYDVPYLPENSIVIVNMVKFGSTNNGFIQTRGHLSFPTICQYDCRILAVTQIY